MTNITPIADDGLVDRLEDVEIAVRDVEEHRNIAANFQSGPMPGTSGWTRMPQPSGMAMGPASVAVTFDGTRYIFVSGNWRSGLWRYVEP